MIPVALRNLLTLAALAAGGWLHLHMPQTVETSTLVKLLLRYSGADLVWALKLWGTSILAQLVLALYGSKTPNYALGHLVVALFQVGLFLYLIMH